MNVALNNKFELYLRLSLFELKQDKSLSQASAGIELILDYCLPAKLIHRLVFTEG